MAGYGNISMAGLSGVNPTARKKYHLNAYTPSTNRSFISGSFVNNM